MKRLGFPAIVLLAGLAVSQAVFTVLVYWSNISFHARLTALKQSGYLVIPNALVMPSLTKWAPAFCGAVFFTVTAGAGLTFLAFFAAWAEKRIFPGSRAYRIVAVLLWIALIAACNIHGPNMSASVAFMIIPASVFMLCLRCMPEGRPSGNGKAIAVHAAVIVIAASAWMPHLERDVFINIRDHLLLSSPAGKSVNAFYYDYTLYPTQLFNALDQKLLKACSLSDAEDGVLKRRLTSRLIQFDYLPLRPEAPHDLKIVMKGSALIFEKASAGPWRIDADAFFADPGTALQQFADIADNNPFFRKFTLMSLLSAFPLAFYVFVHAGIAGLFGFIPSLPLRSMLASGLCLSVAIAALMPLYGDSATHLSPSQINVYLNGNDWRKQRNALKLIADNDKSPLAFNLDPSLATSPHAPVRYWLAQALGAAHGQKAMNLLKTLLDDPQPNVVCMAYYSLGRMGNREAVGIILDRIDGIRHWYTQRYAYNALRRLGWQQTVSDTQQNPLP